MSARAVLIVDDNEDLAESFAEYLRLEGHSVDTVFSGNAGIAAARAAAYDYVIVDVGLPDLNGVEAVHAIRHVSPSARIVLMTGHSAEYLAGVRADLSGTEVLTKPVHPAELSNRIASAIPRDCE